jgi:hypothetical protein
VRQLLHGATAAFALACLACGKTQGIYPVTGTAICKGVPAAGAYVKFVRVGADPSREQTIMAVVQPDGSFSVDCGSFGKGAPPGDYVVFIEWKFAANGRPARSPADARRRPDRLKGRYNDPKHPLLHAVIRPESNVLPAFELEE